MTSMRVLIVEDEAIVAKDIAATLTRLGHVVVGRAATGEAAIELAGNASPDVVLMDISLMGKMDGIEAAAVIRARHHLPVVYLTAYSDDATFERAKITDPYGFLIKPFEERELLNLLLIAVHKHALQERIRQSEETLQAVLGTMSDAVFLTDPLGRTLFMNARAEALTGWTRSEGVGADLGEVADLRAGSIGHPLAASVKKAIAAGETRALGDPVTLRGRLGRHSPVEGVLTPLLGIDGSVRGSVIVVRDLTATAHLDDLVHEVENLRAMLNERIRQLV